MRNCENEVLAMSACAQAKAIREGAFSSEELTSVYLARIERYNAALFAFVAHDSARALKGARARDAERRTTRDRSQLPPFFGLPTAIKDLNMARGYPTRMGSRGYPPIGYVDDLLTAQIRRAGFVIVGKTATSEVGAMPVTEPDTHPPTATPWNIQHTCGGSSGGTASAIAAGLIPLGPASDGAGSIRGPASLNHLVGIKPARGRVANAFKMKDKHLLYCDGPIARTVQDAATLLDAMAGITVGKPHWAPKPPMLFSDAARQAPRRLHIRLSLHHTFSPTDPAIVDAVANVARILEKLGHTITEAPWVQTELDEFLPLFQYMVGHIPLLNLARTQPVTRWLGETGRALDAKFVQARHAKIEHDIITWFDDADVWMTPSVSIPNPKLGLARQPNKTPRELFGEAAVLGAFAAPFNVTGQPAISVPIGLSTAGLPFGVQFAGRPFDETTIIALAAELEREQPFAQRKPPAFWPASAETR